MQTTFVYTIHELMENEREMVKKRRHHGPAHLRFLFLFLFLFYFFRLYSGSNFNLNMRCSGKFYLMKLNELRIPGDGRNVFFLDEKNLKT